MNSLRILLTIQTLEDRVGGNLYVRDLATGFLRHGHTPIVYSKRLGAVADEIRSLTVPVIDHLDALSAAPDIIHGNTPVETMAALLHFRNTPAIFVCHGWISSDAAPPKFPRIFRYIAVDETCQDRLICEEGIPEDRVRIQFNSVDLVRFTPRRALPAKPKRALIFSNNASEKTFIPIIKEACRQSRIALDVAGKNSGLASSNPETILGNYDLVFAKARCALEALAVGTAVILCDEGGVGQMVNSQNMAQLRRENFGWRSLQNPFDVGLLAKEISRYDPKDAATVSKRIRETEGLDGRIASMVEIYREVISEYQQVSSMDANDELQWTARYLESIASITNTFYVAELKKTLDTITEAFDMKPLMGVDEQGIRFTVGAVPSSAKSRQSFTINVEMENRSSKLLCSYAPNPLCFSYHWLDAATSKPVVYDGRRSEIFPPLQPGGTHSYVVECDAPIQKGSYILRLTLVQEGVKWFDQVGSGCVKDFKVLITQ